ncbi:MAG: heavy-metal-associated domain-containing protein [Bacteroidota bacterium]
MKNIISLFSFILCLAFAFSTSAQESPKLIETAEFRVEGVCNMCTKRIENAALVKGVKLAEWDKKTKILKVIFNNKKTDLKTIHKAVADAGHQTSDLPPSLKAYEKLPGCCAYLDGVEDH